MKCMKDFPIAPMKICDLVKDGANLILPAIQRKFVWEEEKICNLFTSVMNKYPIGTLLTWEVSGKTINNDKTISFYEFIKHWSEYDKKFNDVLKNVANNKKYFAILDGQQRIQALLIGLRGTYATHKQNRSWDDIKSFPKKTLYLNLKKQYDESVDKDNYYFEFLEKEDAKKDAKNKWFEVGKIIGLKNNSEIVKYVEKNYVFDNDEDRKQAISMLNELDNCINKTESIGCYVIDKNRSLDEILDIFVRTNSGATPLSKPDLLFSTIISKWPNAREEFDEFIKFINLCNDQSKRFKFDINFLIRSIMYMYEDIPVTLSIKNFRKLDIDKLKLQWDDIKKAIIEARNLLLSFGFEDSNIASYNAIMPIIYYIYHGGDISDDEVIKDIRKYFIIAQLKNLYGNAGNSTLTETRKCLIGKKKFKLSLLKDVTLVGNRTYRLNNENEIAHWLDSFEKGSKYSFMILSLIDPNFDGSKLIDEDHLYPESVLRTYPKYKKYKDKIANLNLLQAKENRKEKSDMMLDAYIKQLKKRNIDCNSVIKCLPPLDDRLTDYKLNHFLVFYKKRRKIMIEAIKKIFE